MKKDKEGQTSLSYFGGDELAARVWSTKFALKDSFGSLYELTPDDIHHRLAGEIARNEENYATPISGRKFLFTNAKKRSRRKKSEGKFKQIRIDGIIAMNYIMSDNMNLTEPQTDQQQTCTSMERKQISIDSNALAHFTPTQREEIIIWVTDYMDKYYDEHILKKVDDIEERVGELEKIPKSFYRSRICSYFVEDKANNYRYKMTINDLNEELRVGFRKKSNMPNFVTKITRWNSDGVLQFTGSNKRDIFDEFMFCFYDEGELSADELQQKWDAFRKASVTWTPK